MKKSSAAGSDSAACSDPTSRSPEGPPGKRLRIAENFDVTDFELTADELAAIDGLDIGRRSGPEPADVTLETFGRAIPEA